MEHRAAFNAAGANFENTLYTEGRDENTYENGLKKENKNKTTKKWLVLKDFDENNFEKLKKYYLEEDDIPSKYVDRKTLKNKTLMLKEDILIPQSPSKIWQLENISLLDGIVNDSLIYQRIKDVEPCDIFSLQNEGKSVCKGSQRKEKFVKLENTSEKFYMEESSEPMQYKGFSSDIQKKYDFSKPFIPSDETVYKDGTAKNLITDIQEKSIYEMCTKNSENVEIENYALYLLENGIERPSIEDEKINNDKRKNLKKKLLFHVGHTPKSKKLFTEEKMKEDEEFSKESLDIFPFFNYADSESLKERFKNKEFESATSRMIEKLNILERPLNSNLNLMNADQGEKTQKLINKYSEEETLNEVFYLRDDIQNKVEKKIKGKVNDVVGIMSETESDFDENAGHHCITKRELQQNIDNSQIEKIKEIKPNEESLTKDRTKDKKVNSKNFQEKIWLSKSKKEAKKSLASISKEVLKNISNSFHEEVPSLFFIQDDIKNTERNQKNDFFAKEGVLKNQRKDGSLNIDPKDPELTKITNEFEEEKFLREKGFLEAKERKEKENLKYSSATNYLYHATTPKGHEEKISNVSIFSYGAGTDITAPETSNLLTNIIKTSKLTSYNNRFLSQKNPNFLTENRNIIFGREAKSSTFYSSSLHELDKIQEELDDDILALSVGSPNNLIREEAQVLVEESIDTKPEIYDFQQSLESKWHYKESELSVGYYQEAPTVPKPINPGCYMSIFNLNAIKEASQLENARSQEIKEEKEKKELDERVEKEKQMRKMAQKLRETEAKKPLDKQFKLMEKKLISVETGKKSFPNIYQKKVNIQELKNRYKELKKNGNPEELHELKMKIQEGLGKSKKKKNKIYSKKVDKDEKGCYYG